MDSNFFVRYEGYYNIISRVYAVDTVRHEFLIVDNYDDFKWVPTDDCELISKEEAERYDYE